MTNQPIAIDLTEAENAHGVFDYHNVGWILFQEQYDRKSGDHQGTRIHLLANGEYDIVSYSYKTDIEDINTIEGTEEIVIPYPGKFVKLESEKFLWAKLRRGEDLWQLYNERDYSIIPIYTIIEDEVLDEGSVQLCKRQDISPFTLKNGHCFIVHTTEFRIFRLPKLALFRVSILGEKTFLTQISEDKILLDHNLDLISESHNTILMSIDGCKVGINNTVEYKSIFLPKRQLDRGSYVLPLFPGDLFETPDTSINLMIDHA